MSLCRLWKAKCARCDTLALLQGTPTMAAFIRSGAFDGARDGYVFKDGVKGLGYYRDEGPEAAEAAPEAAAAAPTWSVQCLDGTLTLSQDSNMSESQVQDYVTNMFPSAKLLSEPIGGKVSYHLLGRNYAARRKRFDRMPTIAQLFG